MARPFASGLVALALLLAPVAKAQQLVTAGQPEEIENIARGYGSANLTEDNRGDPMVTGRIDGTRYQVLFYGCTNGAECRSIQFSAGWITDGAVSRAQIGEWNRTRRFGKAFLDNEGDPVLQWDVNLFGGVSRRNLDDTFDWWRIVLAQFEDSVF